MKKLMSIFLVVLLLTPSIGFAQEQEDNPFKLPDSIIDISNQNTYPNPHVKSESVEPSELTKELLESSNHPIENTNLVRFLNESNITQWKAAFGVKANIYLGNWALNYDSKETSFHWEFKKVNSNILDNRGGNQTRDLTYQQLNEKTVNGGFTSNVHAAEDVKSLIISHVQNKTGHNVSFKSTIGKGTKDDIIMRVPIRKVGNLQAYVPAISEKGNITYGEVYLVLNGNDKKIVIKNITNTGIGAWIPLQDKLYFKFLLSDNLPNE